MSGPLGLHERVPIVPKGFVLHERLICHCALDQKCRGDVLISSFIGCFEGKGLEGDFVAKVGSLRTPSEHVQEANGITRPFSTLSADDEVKVSITKTLKMGPTAIKERWQTTLARWRDRAEVLEARERELHQSIETEVAHVLAGKRLLLFDELMRESGCPSADELTHKIARGFKVVGALCLSGAFAPQPRTEASSN